MTSHIMIPDTQVKPGCPLHHIKWANNYIRAHKPGKVILIGDWWDMPSLSTWNKKIEMEGQRYRSDIECGMDALSMLMKGVKAQVHYCEGNHEDRISRYVANVPELEGHIDISDCNVEKFGIKRHAFLKPVRLNGVLYCHYFHHSHSSTSFGNARLMVKAVHESCSAGHLQTLDSHIENVPNTKRYIRGLIAGAFYLHHEDYKGPQGNNHWRGLIHKTNVQRGMYDLNEVSMHTLRRDYA